MFRKAKPIVDLLEGFRRSHVLYTAVDLKIFEVLEKPKEGMSVCDIRTTLKSQYQIETSQAHLERFLESCVCLELLERSTDGRFGLTSLSKEFLCDNSKHTLVAYVQHSKNVVSPLYGHLATAVQTGEMTWKQALGFDTGKDAFEAEYSTEHAKERFGNSMRVLSKLSSGPLVEGLKEWLQTIQNKQAAPLKLCDIGGGTGTLLLEFLNAFPECNGILFELDSVTPMARKYLAQQDQKHNIEVVSGSFFESTLPPANVYFLSRILHDWNDQHLEQILTNVYNSMPKGTYVVICEMLLRDSSTEPEVDENEDRKSAHLSTCLQDLNMMVQTGGSERSVSGYRALLEPYGFEYQFSLDFQLRFPVVNPVVFKKPQ